MEIIQKKGRHKYTFTLKDEQLNYHYEDQAGSGDVDLYYADFPFKSSVRIDQNEWLRNVGYLWIALGVFILVFAAAEGADIARRGFWIIIGLGCVAWAHFSKVRFSVFSSDRGAVWVIQDGKHDEIIRELEKRRNEQLLKWYGEINPNNTLQQEIDKFRWLVDRGVMATEEADSKIAQVELMHKDDPDVPGERLN